MMDALYQDEYQSKLTTPEQAIKLVPAVGNLGVSMAVSHPPSLLKALEQRILAKDIKHLTMYYQHAQDPLHETLLKLEHMEYIEPRPLFLGHHERALLELGRKNNKRTVVYCPTSFSGVPGLLREVGIDVFLMSVAPMDKSGYFSCGTNADYTIPTARIAKTLIIEVNPNMPRVSGNCSVHISEVHAIVEHTSILPQVPMRGMSDLDRQIGKIIVEMVPNKACMQFGIGGVPNSVCEMLVNHKDLGIHTELMSPGIINLIRSGAVSNRHKYINAHKSVYTFALGDKDMYDFLNDNSAFEAHPVDYVNMPYIIGQNDNVVSINAFLQIDLLGQVNSEFMNGTQYSAVGGQLDFMRGAQHSKGGKSILAASATAGGGKFSRIVPNFSGPVTDPRVDTHYIVTEFGKANLRGKSEGERAKELIEIAHPNFRAELYQKAKELGYIY